MRRGDKLKKLLMIFGSTIMAIKKEIRLTREGMDELKSELADLKKRRLEVAERLRAAKEQGDLSENADWSSAQDEHKFVEGRISELEHALQNAQLIKTARGNAVQIGCRVTLQDGGAPITYHLVGSLESNPAEGKISDDSPLGKLLMGKKVGDSVDLARPTGSHSYKITKIA
jgi:transcription elongation factor GreA